MKKFLIILLFSWLYSQSVITGVKDLTPATLDSTASLGDVPAGMITILDGGGAQVDLQYAMGFSDMNDLFGSVAIAGYVNDGENGTHVTASYNDSGYVFIEGNAGTDADVDFVRKTVADDGAVWNRTDASTSHDMAYLLFGGGQAEAKSGQFQPDGDVGNQSITGVGFVPNAVIFMGMAENDGGGHEGNSEADARFQFGFMADNGGEAGVSHNVRTTNLNAYRSFSAVGVPMHTTTTLEANFSYVSMDADGFTIDWNIAGNAAHFIQYLAIGGVEAYVDTAYFQTGTGTFSETGVGFQPDFIIGVHGGRSTTGGTSNVQNGMGFANGTATTDQHYMTWSGDHAEDPTVVDQRSDDTYFLYVPSRTGGTDGYMDIDSFDADGVTFNQLDANPTKEIFGYLAIKILADDASNPIFHGLNF